MVRWALVPLVMALSSCQTDTRNDARPDAPKYDRSDVHKDRGSDSRSSGRSYLRGPTSY